MAAIAFSLSIKTIRVSSGKIPRLMEFNNFSSLIFLDLKDAGHSGPDGAVPHIGLSGGRQRDL